MNDFKLFILYAIFIPTELVLFYKLDSLFQDVVCSLLVAIWCALAVMANGADPTFNLLHWEIERALLDNRKKLVIKMFELDDDENHNDIYFKFHREEYKADEESTAKIYRDAAAEEELALKIQTLYQIVGIIALVNLTLAVYLGTLSNIYSLMVSMGSIINGVRLD